jgi:hypothetical protein
VDVFIAVVGTVGLCAAAAITGMYNVRSSRQREGVSELKDALALAKDALEQVAEKDRIIAEKDRFIAVLMSGGHHKARPDDKDPHD